MTTTEKETHTCSCGHTHTVSEREIVIYKGLVIALWRVFRWCEEKGRHEFDRKEIKHLLLTETETARFGDLVYFGGLLYKRAKAHYGLNMERCRDFFAGEYEIPRSVFKNPITGETTPKDYCTISQIPKLTAFLDENQMYIIKYREKNETVEEIEPEKQPALL